MNDGLLVTGGCGFIGSNFVRYMHKSQDMPQIVILDSMTYAVDPHNRVLLEQLPNVVVIAGSITNDELVRHVLQEYQLQHIVHFAAESHVDNSICNPRAFVETNVLGTQVLLEAARTVWQLDSRQYHRFHHISTDEVFGMLNDVDPAFDEATPYNPSSPYSASKAASDHLVQSYNHTFGLNTVITNCSNNYGPYQHDEKLMPTVIRCCLQGEPIPIYGQGLNIRDWLYVEDHCIALEAVLYNGRSGGRYCIGGRCEVRNIDLVKQICSAIDKMAKTYPCFQQKFPLCPASHGHACVDLMSFVEDRLGHDWRYAIDDSLLEREIVELQRHTLHEGLEKTLQFYFDKYV